MSVAPPESTVIVDREDATRKLQDVLDREIRGYQALGELTLDETRRMNELQSSIEKAQEAIHRLMERLGVQTRYFDSKEDSSVLPPGFDRDKTSRFLEMNSKVFDLSLLEKVAAAACFIIHRDLHFDTHIRSVVLANQKTLKEQIEPLIPLEKNGNLAHVGFDLNEAVLSEIAAMRGSDAARVKGGLELLDDLVCSFSVEIEDAAQGIDTRPPVDRVNAERKRGRPLTPVLALELPLRKLSLWMYLF